MGSDFAALDNFFIYVKDLSDQDFGPASQADYIAKMNVWSVSEDEKWDLLDCVVKPEDLESTVAVIVLDFDRPWDLMASLKRWLNALQNFVFGLNEKMPSGMFPRLKDRVEKHIKTFKDPVLDQNGNITNIV